MPLKLTSLSYLGLAVETTQGTPVAPTGFIPIRSYKPQDKPQYIPDTGFRGQPVDTFGEYLGPISSTYSLEGDFFPTATGNLLANLFGTDTVSGTAAPYTHTLTVAATPGTLTLSDYYVAGYRQWPGQKVQKMELKFSPEAGLTYTADLIGWPSATGTPPSTITFGVNPFYLGWEAALTLNGTADALLEDATISIERTKSKVYFAANNTQHPADVFVGPMTADWDLTFYMESDTEYTLALSQNPVPVVVTFTQPGTGYTLKLQSSKVQFTQPTIDRSQEYVRVRLQGTAIYNPTDSGVILAALTNATSTAYTSQAVS